MYDERRRQGELNAATERGMTAGLELGRKEGREEGREQGSKQKAVEIARKLMDNGMSQEEAAAFVGVSVEDLGDNR